MKTEFDTFRIKQGKEARAKEWMQLLVSRKSECIETLNREKMGFETIFMTEKDGRMYLSWFSVQGESGESVDHSELEIDKLHCEFWDECIDTSFELDKFEHVVTFVPAAVEAALLEATK